MNAFCLFFCKKNVKNFSIYRKGKENNKKRKKKIFRFITSDEFRRTKKFFGFPPPQLDKNVIHD